MENQADMLVRQARTWVGTRFHHQGRLKKTESHRGGVDCLGLLVGVAGELGLRDGDGVPLAKLDAVDYGHVPDAARLKCVLEKHLTAVPGLGHGAVVLFEIDRSPRHLGILAHGNGGYSLIHAYAPARMVVEHRLDAGWRARVVGIYSAMA